MCPITGVYLRQKASRLTTEKVDDGDGGEDSDDVGENRDSAVIFYSAVIISITVDTSLYSVSPGVSGLESLPALSLSSSMIPCKLL